MLYLKLIGLSFGAEEWSVANNFFGKKTLKPTKIYLKIENNNLAPKLYKQNTIQKLIHILFTFIKGSYAIGCLLQHSWVKQLP